MRASSFPDSLYRDTIVWFRRVALLNFVGLTISGSVGAEVDVVDSETSAISPDANEADRVRPESEASASTEPEPLLDENAEAIGNDDPERGKRAFIDTMQVGIEGGIENTARWFDGFFGGRRYGEWSGQSYGRLTANLLWQDREGWDPSVRLRARYALPGLSNRVNAIIGRGDTDALLNDYQSDFTELFPTDRDDEWLAGFGYAPPWSRSKRVSLGGGVRFSGGIQPYVRISYNYRQELGGRTIMTVRPTGFWRNDEGFGWTVNFDVEHKLGPRSMLRLSSWWEESEVSLGVRHETYLTFYQQLSASRGFSVMVGTTGETEGLPAIQDYGFLVTYRQRMWRDWFYGKLMFGLSWLRQDLFKDRHADPVLGFGFDLIFGDNPNLEPLRPDPSYE